PLTDSPQPAVHLRAPIYLDDSRPAEAMAPETRNTTAALYGAICLRISRSAVCVWSWAVFSRNVRLYVGRASYISIFPDRGPTRFFMMGTLGRSFPKRR